MILAGAVSRQIPAEGLLKLLIAWISFWVVFSPYFFLLHELTGSWQLTGKSRIAIADGLSYYLQRPDLKMDPRFTEIGYLDLMRDYPGYIRHNLTVNLVRCAKEMLPPWLWGISLLGCVVGGWRGRALLVRGYLVATFAPLTVIIIFFFIGPEYTQPYLPVLFLWAGHGLVWLVTFVGERRGALRAAVIVPVLMAIGYAGYLVAMQFPSERNLPYHYTQDEGRYDDKQVGMRLRMILPQNAVIMTRSLVSTLFVRPSTASFVRNAA